MLFISLRAGLSRACAAPLVRRYRRSLDLGCVPMTRMSLWPLLPVRVKKWMKYRVLSPREEHAWLRVLNHDTLGALFMERPPRAAISPSTILFLWDLLKRNKPQRILEFGGGTSTAVLGAYASMMQEDGYAVRILSLDHDRYWLEQTRCRLREEKCQASISLIHAPISEQTLLHRKMDAYTVVGDTLREAAGERGFDLCIIDGPPGRIGRAGCLPLAQPYLANRATVFLDDARRDGEQTILREWQSTYRANLSRPRFVDDLHGVAVMRWHAKPFIDEN